MPDTIRFGHTLGAFYLGDQTTRFRVWAPQAEQMEVRLITPEERLVPMERSARGYWAATVQGIEPGCFYVYRLNGEKDRPDPASRYQPDGVHGPSQVMAGDDFEWEDTAWSGIPLDRYIIYELHIGTFTPEGTFEAAIPYLPGLKELGVTAIEIMPVAQFPGTRNWGYDGVGLFAVQNSYGGPEGLKRLVEAAHQEGLAVILDVVYNHLGAEGNYLWDYGPYFTDRYKTPWGSAVNFDGPASDEVRRYFFENAIYWITDFHVDALRLDAVHAILDFSAGTFLEDLAAAVDRQRACLNRRIYLIAESDLNNHRVILPLQAGGYGLDAQWMDDFHHSVHTLLTHESNGYYQDYTRPDGKPLVEYLAKALREGYIYSGQYSRYRKRRHGNSSAGVPAGRLIVAIQNHDQVGNRMQGDRLSTLVPFSRLKLGAAILLLSPFVPMLFMGEEYGETNPFQYFVSHGDQELVEAVRVGRGEEFSDFIWGGEAPDPAAEETYARSKLCRQDAQSNGHRVLYELYRALIQLRQELPALRLLDRDCLQAVSYEREQTLFLRRWAGADAGQPGGEVFAVFNFGVGPAEISLPVPAGRWRKSIDSAAAPWYIEHDDELLSPPLGSIPAPVARTGPQTAKARANAAPDQLNSKGEVTLKLNGASFALYIKENQA